MVWGIQMQFSFWGIALLAVVSFINITHAGHLSPKQCKYGMHDQVNGEEQLGHVTKDSVQNGKEMEHRVSELEHVEPVSASPGISEPVNETMVVKPASEGVLGAKHVKSVSEFLGIVQTTPTAYRVQPNSKRETPPNKKDVESPPIKADEFKPIGNSKHVDPSIKPNNLELVNEPINKADDVRPDIRAKSIESVKEDCVESVYKAGNAKPVSEIQKDDSDIKDEKEHDEYANNKEKTTPATKIDVSQSRKEINDEPVSKLDNIQPAIEADMDTFDKRVIGADKIVKDMRRTPSIPSYVLLLYHAIEDESLDATRDQKESVEIPTIRTVKPYSTRSKYRYVFKLKNHIKRIERLEIVLNLKDSAWETRSCDGPIMISIFTKEHGWRYHEGKRFEDFLIVNIYNVLEDKTITMARNLQVGNKSRRISRRLEPLLVAFENRASNPLFRVPNRVRRNRPEPEAESAHAPANHISSFEERAASQQVSSLEYYHCRRYDWTINMDSFRWNWYAYPSTINLGFCSGECPFPLDVPSLNSTNHSFLKNRWRVSSHGLDESVPGECCTPISYLPASIIYLSSSMEYVMREMPNMRVRTCGCR